MPKHDIVKGFIQPKARNVEAARIVVIRCARGTFYIYEYLERLAFRAIRPPHWGTPLGGKDHNSYQRAVIAACS